MRTRRTRGRDVTEPLAQDLNLDRESAARDRGAAEEEESMVNRFRNPNTKGVPSLADRTPVADVMTTRVVSVHPNLGLEALCSLFVERNISGAPVIDATGHPIGIVSKTDLVRRFHENGHMEAEDATPRIETRREPEWGIGLERGFHTEPVPQETVADIMMPIAFTLSETASLSQAAALMAFEGVHRVPVVSEEGVVVGILSSLDILRWTAEQDGYLRSPASAT